MNNLTLFGLVLAIGIVVDDAIVVLENIERWLEKGLPVREATIRAMDEITGPIIAITLVLSSVFLPSAFLSSITGQFFRQFALTISVSMIISAINAMTMTPARAGSIFGSRKPGEHGHQGKEALPWWFFAIIGGLISVWLLQPMIGEWVGVPSGEGDAQYRPGNLTSTVGRLPRISRAVCAGRDCRRDCRPDDHSTGQLGAWVRSSADSTRCSIRATQVYGRIVGWAIRLSAIVVVAYLGIIALTGFGFTASSVGLHSRSRTKAG